MVGNTFMLVLILKKIPWKVIILNRCCKTRPERHRVKYSCGENPDEEMILCDYHFNLSPIMKEHIKKIEDFVK